MFNIFHLSTLNTSQLVRPRPVRVPIACTSLIQAWYEATLAAAVASGVVAAASAAGVPILPLIVAEPIEWPPVVLTASVPVSRRVAECRARVRTSGRGGEYNSSAGPDLSQHTWLARCKSSPRTPPKRARALLKPRSVKSLHNSGSADLFREDPRQSRIPAPRIAIGVAHHLGDARKVARSCTTATCVAPPNTAVAKQIGVSERLYTGRTRSYRVVRAVQASR